jgi:CopG family nickel-responsive transcriptional regulator
MERFTISLDDRLAEQFDGWIAKRSYSNRSEAVRDLLRAELGKTAVHSAATQHCVACLSYVFNHHERQLAERLASLQHDHHELTISTMHAHLDHEHCLETVLLRGRVSAVTHFADEVCAERGVHHGKLNLISVDLHQPHDHSPPKGPGASAITAHIHLKPTT